MGIISSKEFYLSLPAAPTSSPVNDPKTPISSQATPSANKKIRTRNRIRLKIMVKKSFGTGDRGSLKLEIKKIAKKKILLS